MKLFTIMNNLFIFLTISLVNTFISIKLPLSIFHFDSWLFKVRNWERNGRIYQDCLSVKKWKNRLPELSDFLSFLFSKKQMEHHNTDYLYRFALETCRAELAHWCIILSSLIFTQWNPTGMSLLMIFLAVLLNLPYIIIQRYNRPRILAILSSRRTDMNDRMVHDWEVIHKDI
ncbi:glycosyl-4,4'-diaponeurosporenoate acyltransferase [Sporolactobacillus sp. Y61]|uniref:Glycosyl-4,4'-diaponeurosporenoate acyltransferase n=1 Tax=Sporolactobacillus sp. Y61 TaxID=3160863 RepID=A0AAU8IGB7_9BACL